MSFNTWLMILLAKLPLLIQIFMKLLSLNIKICKGQSLIHQSAKDLLRSSSLSQLSPHWRNTSALKT